MEATSRAALKQETNDRRIGVIFTVVFHILLLILFLYIGLKQPVPLPREEAIELTFESAGGPAGGGAPAAQAEAPPPPQDPAAPEVPEPVATQEESPVAAPVVEKPKPKPEPQPEQPKERKPDERALFTPSNTGTPGASTSSASTGPGSGQGSGGGSAGGTGGFHGQGFEGRLTGRGLVRGPRISEKPNEGGRVALDIWVDRSGKVTHVALNLNRSTTTSQVLYNLARTAALQCTFSAKPDGPAEQKGEMTFIFQLE